MERTFKPKAFLGKGNYIFISYSHADEDMVYDFINCLQTKYNVWFDEGIHFGTEWDEEIVRKIEECSLFIFAITKNSLNSKNCKDEIAFAKDNGIPFINVLFENVDLESTFKFRFGRFQMLKYFEYSDKTKVLDDLERRSDEIKLTINNTSFEATQPIEEKKEQVTTARRSSSNQNDYALFSFEKEITLFSLLGSERDLAIKKNEYFDDDGDRVYRIVMLPTDSMKAPVQKVELFEMSLLDKNEKKICSFNSRIGIDGKYSQNILDRGYNCVNFDIKTNKDLLYFFNKVKFVRMAMKIESIFGISLNVNFEIILNGKKDNKRNPDVKKIKDLVSFEVHHCRYLVTK